MRARFFAATWSVFAMLSSSSCATPAQKQASRSPVTTQSTATQSTNDRKSSGPQLCGRLADGSRRFRILHINDVYRIQGLLNQTGGLARLRTLRKTLEADCSDVLLTHAGDALFPSLLSREYQGGQMIEALNGLDGAFQGFDERMLMTFGNHEFDQSKCKDAENLRTQIQASQFDWLDTNITWKMKCMTDRGQSDQEASSQPNVVSEVKADNLHQYRMLDLGGVKVGLFSLTTASKRPEYVEQIDDHYEEAAAKAVAHLRGQGAELVLAMTHLGAAEDAQILKRWSGTKLGPDLILGGHDHNAMTRDQNNDDLGKTTGVSKDVLACGGGRTSAGPRDSKDRSVERIEGNSPVVFKGDADAASVRVIEVTLDPKGNMHWSAQTIVLGEQYPEDPDLRKQIVAKLDAHEAIFCSQNSEPTGCLNRTLTRAGTDLIAEESEIRRYETNLGSWVTDRMLEAFEKDRPQIALMNAGGLRLNQDIPEGAALDQRIMEELFAYPTPMVLLEIDGATVQRVLDRSVQEWEGNGHWLQLAGLAYRHDVVAGKATDAVVLTKEGPVPLNPKARYQVVTSEFLAEGNDGYAMLRGKKKRSIAEGTDLKQVVLNRLENLGPSGVLAPVFQGRICSSDRPNCPCLVPGP